MGDGVGIRCANCGYERNLYAGAGYEDSGAGGLMRMVRGWQREQIEAVVRDHPRVEFDFYRAAFRCPTCHDLSDGLRIIGREDGVAVYGTPHGCARCRCELEELETLDEIEKGPCPKCGQATLENLVAILWD